MNNTTTTIKATCAIIDAATDQIISERIIGEFENEDIASFEAFKQRKDGETVCLYNCPIQEEEELTAREMAENEVDWMLLHKEL